MANIQRRKRLGRIATALGSAAASVAFFVAIANGPQPANTTLSTPAAAAQSAPATTGSASPRLNNRGTTASPSFVANTPRLRTRGS